MGGRGASIGISTVGNTYGTQDRTVLEKDEIKFVEKVSRGSEALMETKTWHVHVGYLHSENSEEAHEKLKEKDVRLVEKVIKLWNNRKANQKVV